MTLQTHPRHHALSAPDRPAFILADTNESLSYSELVARSDKASQLFASLGIQQGDTVAFLLENHIRYPELLWAAKNSGLRYVSISTQLNGADICYIVADCRPKLLVTSRRYYDVAKDLVGTLPAATKLLMIDGALPPFQAYEDLLESQDAVPLEGRIRGSSMLYSSGTTGRPKGVETAISPVSPTVPPDRFATLVGQYGFDDNTVFINPGPLYHAGPLRFSMTVQRCGGTVIGFQKFDPAAVLAAIGRFGGTHGFFVPTMFSRLLRLPQNLRRAARLDTMRHAIHGAAPCGIDTKRAMIEWWGPIIDELYSGTEAIGHTFISSKEWLLHPGSVGRPVGKCELKIVDSSGCELPVGVPGRIMMRNGLRFVYHGDAAKTDAVYDDEGFASLGDIGYVDCDGYLFLTDRESHMIIAGGVNIYPQEAENILIAHEGVEDVAVFGVPHADMGEEVKAVVQPVQMPTDPASFEAELIAFCRDRLSKIKCPRSIDFVAELPRTEMGKLSKNVLKEKYRVVREN